jgi:hypothetical protein
VFESLRAHQSYLEKPKACMMQAFGPSGVPPWLRRNSVATCESLCLWREAIGRQMVRTNARASRWSRLRAHAARSNACRPEPVGSPMCAASRASESCRFLHGPVPCSKPQRLLGRRLLSSVNTTSYSLSICLFRTGAALPLSSIDVPVLALTSSGCAHVCHRTRPVADHR